MKKLITKQYIKQGGSIPRGYGIAYFRPDMAVAVAYPLGIHWIVRWSVRFYAWAAYMYAPSKFEKALWDAEERGRSHGYALGIRECERMVEEYTRRIIHGNSTDSKT